MSSMSSSRVSFVHPKRPQLFSSSCSDSDIRLPQTSTTDQAKHLPNWRSNRFRSILGIFISPFFSFAAFYATSPAGSSALNNESDSTPSYQQPHPRQSKPCSNSVLQVSDSLPGSSGAHLSSAELASPRKPGKQGFKIEHLREKSPISVVYSSLIRLPKVIMSFPNPKLQGSLRKVMQMITDDHDLMLSDTDMSLFTLLEGHESFKYGDCFGQLESSGICVEAPKGTAMPEAPDNAWSFRFGPEQRKVVLVPERLSAIGFSVVSWIFTATEDYKRLYMILVNTVPFRNCLIEKLSSQKHTMGIDNKDTKIVIPMGWLYTLGVDSSFVLEHGEYGDFGTALGYK